MAEEKKKLGIAILSISAAVLVVLVIAQILFEPSVRDQAGCEIERESTKYQHIVLFDQSEAYSGLLAERVKDFVTDLASDELEEGDRLTIVEMHPEGELQGGAGIPIFDRCKPKSPDDANEIIENPLLVSREFSSEFASPLHTALNETLSKVGGGNSPIVEAIYDLSLQKRDDYELTYIYLVSDMLQHSSNYSHYRDGISFENFQRSNLYSRTNRSFNDINPTVLYIERLNQKGEIQGDQHKQFWTDYFESLNARSRLKIESLH